MCLNGKEAGMMIDVSRRNGVALSAFHNRRWDWDCLTVKKVIQDTPIGDPYPFEVAIRG